MPSTPREEYVRGPDGRIVERHLHRNLKGGTFRADTVVLLGNEDQADVVAVQTFADHGENLVIEGGFYAINASTAATEYARLQQQRQMERDRMEVALERDRIALQRERQQAELEIERLRAQNGAASTWSNGGQAPYMSTNAHPGFMGNPMFFGPPWGAYQSTAGYGQSSGYPFPPGPPLHSQSETQVPTFPQPHPAPPPSFPRAQTDSDLRSAPQFTEPDTTTNSHQGLKEKFPEAPRHTPRGS